MAKRYGSISMALLILLVHLPAIGSGACFGQDPGDVLLEVGHRNITGGEFLYYFEKNHPGGTPDDKERFLWEFIDYQLKVSDALEERVNQNPAFINELTEYRLLLAAPYLTDREMEKEFVHEALERSQYERNVTLVRFTSRDPSAPAADEALYRVAMERRAQMLDGIPAEQSALPPGSPEHVLVTAGNPEWIQVFQLDYALETAAFELEPGGVSMPVPTPEGVTLVVLHAIRPAASGKMTEEDALQKIREGSDGRKELLRASFTEQLKTEWGFTENRAALQEILDLADERVYRGMWMPPPGEAMSDTLFLIDGKPSLQSGFIEFMSDYFTTGRTDSVRNFVEKLYQKYTGARLFTYENYMLDRKYPEFGYQLEEYRNAMLILEITRRRVWNRVDAGDGTPEELMEAWIAQLREKYPVRINERLLHSPGV